MKIYSTGVSRTLKSAIAHVIGLLNEETTKSLLKDLYVANNDHEYDPMMRMKTYVDCQALYDRGTQATKIIQRKIFKSKKVRTFSREVEWKFGLKPFRKLRDVSDVFDQLYSDFLSSKKPRFTFESPLLQKLYYIK